MLDAIYMNAEGVENGLVVRAVSSVDEAWFVPDKGLLLRGVVTPVELSQQRLRIDPFPGVASEPIA